jgi:hypothetical protein
MKENDICLKCNVCISLLMRLENEERKVRRESENILYSIRNEELYIHEEKPLYVMKVEGERREEEACSMKILTILYY